MANAVSFDGSESQLLTADDVLAMYPSVNADGSKIAFSTPAGEAYIINVNVSDKYLASSQGRLYRIDIKSKKVLEKIKLSLNKNKGAWELSCGNIKEDGYYKLVISVKDKANNKVTHKSLNKKVSLNIK